MSPLSAHFDAQLPYWCDYQALLERFDSTSFPDCDTLNSLLPAGLRSTGGQRIRFVPSDTLDDEPYELRIFERGEVSTRPDSWHDLLNALVWARFPSLKMAMNARHYECWDPQNASARGPVRDALTLFDECGVIICSANRTILDAIANRHWPQVFAGWRDDRLAEPFVCGHAMLEKFLAPYKSMTAKALLIHADTDNPPAPRMDMLTLLDQALSRGILDHQLLNAPRCLAPLPLAGLPGWWPEEQQKQPGFYQDRNVFRHPPENLEPAPVFSLRALLD